MEIDKNKYPELHSLRSEIKSYIAETFQSRKKFFLSLILAFLTLMIFCAFYLIKTIPTTWNFLNSDYKYHVKTLVWVNIGAPVNISVPTDEIFQIPFKETLDLTVPFKAVIPIPINQNFEIPIEKPVSIKLDHTFPIKETVRVKTVVPLDTTTQVKAFGISKNVAIKADVPFDAEVPIDHPFRLNDTLSFNVKEPLSIFINHTFNVPMDLMVDVELPLDLKVAVPMKFNYKTQIDVKEKIPIIVEFDIVINPLGGIKIDGIMMDGKKVTDGKNILLPEGSETIFNKDINPIENRDTH